MRCLELRTGYADYSKTYYKTKFFIVDHLPEVGGAYDGEKVVTVDPVELDAEERSEAAQEYNLFQVETEDGRRAFVACEKPKIRVELHHWKEFSGYSHSETFDIRFAGEFVNLAESAKEYYKNFDGDLLDGLEPGEGINIEMYDDNNNLVSEYFIVKE
ncbi:MAG: hypothetical protein IKH28_02965 [Lachnospiraceae bacterium]|nr:hypothetical protein [Lachnospiraceae bacterium]